MSVNLLASNRLTGPTVAEILAADPDVLLLQEYSPHWHAAISDALADRYPLARHVVRSDSFGVAIYARRPLIGEVDFDVRLGSAGTPQMRAVLNIGGREVVFYNVHLVPPSAYEWIIEQRVEFADLLDRIERESSPTIVTGDFNFTNNCAFADALRRAGFVDAHFTGGSGRGATWPDLGLLRHAPGIRLDHFFLSGQLSATTSRVGVGEGSDHRPILAEVGFVATDPQ